MLGEVTRFLQPLGRTLDKGITSENFNKMIEPYGILIKILEQFVQDKKYSQLVELLTTLNSGIIKDQGKSAQSSSGGADGGFSIITDNNSAITKGRIYVDRLDQAVPALKLYNFDNFKKEIDKLVNAAGTVNQQKYDNLMNNVKKTMSLEALRSFVAVIRDLNTGNYSNLEGFETKDVKSFSLVQQRIDALKTLVGQLDPLISTLSGKTTDQVDIEEFKKAYKKILDDPGFAESLSVEQRDKLRGALKQLFESIGDRFKKLQN